MDSLRDWENYRIQRQAYPEAAEKGRLLAVRFIVDDPDTRKRVEDRYGIDFCRRMYPEAYQSGFAKLIRRIHQLIPW